MADQRKKLVLNARITEQTERYDDMAANMKELVENLKNYPKQQLEDEERNLLSVAYKNIVGTRRNAWRILETSENHLAKSPKPNKDDGIPVERKIELCQEFKETVEKELNGICDEVIALLDSHLIQNAGGAESQVFYQKMKGDYYRYKVEVATEGKAKKDLTKNSREAYKSAWDKALKDLPAVHPIRLGLALNFSVFHYEIDEDHNSACELAKKAFDEAMKQLDEEQQCRHDPRDDQEDDHLKDSSLILQLLRDNLTLWRSDNNVDDDDQEAYQQEEK